MVITKIRDVAKILLFADIPNKIPENKIGNKLLFSKFRRRMHIAIIKYGTMTASGCVHKTASANTGDVVIIITAITPE